MLRIPKSELRTIQAHARESYPHECCGILVGTQQNSEKTVARAIRAQNLNTERAQDRYLLDPKAQMQAEREAREAGQQVLGFYHSHPDHPALPSGTDNEQSWPEYSYLIVKVTASEIPDVNCFRRTEQPALTTEKLEII